ncbi:tyrosine-type recombinase/integrase [Nocardia sp. CA-120079]|uniref:tyrosine-type recombinase/integrase n=1 Tax=Nocardia sp. CA-120079 TaxID=3239974 RepID=UPI003D96ED81
MPTPRPRPRNDGSVAWNVPYNYYDEVGKRRGSSETFDDYESAADWCELIDKVGLNESLRVLEIQQSAGPDLTALVPWLRKYTQRLTGIEERTRKDYIRYIDLDIAPFLGETLPITAFNQDLDAAWIVHLEQDKGNGAKTIHNKHGFLSGALNAAVAERPAPLIPYNPCLGIRLPRHDAPELDIFDNDEWELFEQLMPQRWRPHAEFNLVSMARPSEVTALQIRDIDKKTGDIRINKAWKHVGSRMVLGKPKSQRGTRTVTVPLASLERFNLDRPGDELLVHTSNDTPISAGYFYGKAWVPALRRLRALSAGDLNPFTRKAQWKGADADYLVERFGDAIATMRDKRLTPYTLRHTGISWKLQDGVPLFVVSRDAGHKDVNTTDRRYGHNDRRASAAAAQIIASRLPRARAAMLRVAA